MALIDTHTHLESYVKPGTLDATLARAHQAGVAAMVTVGTSSEDWTLYRDLAAAHRGFVHYSVGLHPCSVGENWADEIAQLPAFWQNPGNAPAALGECGLDRFHLPKDIAGAEKILAWQRAAFAAQLTLAKSLGCPLIVHSRGAFSETVGMIDASGVDWNRVVFHCFSEGAPEIAELNRRGGCGSFTGILTYKNAATVRAAAQAQGLARLMVETDAPWLSPLPHRGKPNEPAFVRHTAEFAAQEIFGVSFETLATATTANAKAFFSI